MRSLRAGRWGAPPVADTCESERWEKKLRHRGRGRDAGEGGGGKQLCFFSRRLSGPAWDGSPVAMTNLTFCNSSLPSSRWIIHSSGSPKWALTLWKISLRSKICVCLRDPDVGWADTWELGWSSFRGRAGPSLQSPLDSSRVSSSSCLSVVPFGSRPSRTPLRAFSRGLPLNSSPPESFLAYDPISNISPTQNSLIYASFP